jgi:type IV secretory pathway VirJ component
MLDLSNVPAEFVDVEFPADPNYVAGDITVIGEMPRCRAYGDSQVMVPTAEWKPLSQAIAAEGGGCTRYVTRVLNQSSEGSCVGNAGTQQHQILQAKQFGKANVTQLSAISLYQLIGRSPNNGLWSWGVLGIPSSTATSHTMAMTPTWCM